MVFLFVCLSQKYFIADETREINENFWLSEVKSFLLNKFPVLEFLKFLAISESGFLIKSFLSKKYVYCRRNTANKMKICRCLR